MIRRLMVAALLLPALAGCEISSDLAARADPPPADGRPYPNLASVPPNPRRVQPAATQAQMRALEAERQAAREADAKLRAAAIPDAPPPPVRLPPVGPGGVSAITPPELGPPATSGTAVLSLEFAAGATRLAEPQRRQIRNAAGNFNRPDSRIRVVGVWATQADRRVARARAEAVAGEIIRQGVPARRVDIRDASVAAGGAPIERRVEIFVDY